MDKTQKIERLKKFEEQISTWFEIRQKGYSADQELEEKTKELAKGWGTVSEILKGLDYNLEIEIADSNRSKSIRPKLGDLFHDGIFAVNNTHVQYEHMRKLFSFVLSAIQKIESGVIVRENVLPNVNLLFNVLNSFPDVVSRLKYRRSGKSPLEIKDEYDVQDIVYVMLKGVFPTLQYEDPTSKVGPNSARADFTISDLGVFIETKYISEKGKEKIIHDECLTDIQKYGKQDSCQKIIFFVYDPEKCIDNQYAYKAGTGGMHTFDGKEVEVLTLIFN